MNKGLWKLSSGLVTLILLTLALTACTTETIEVTRVKIMERRVIERVVITVEVTRLQEVIVTATPGALRRSPTADSNVEESPTPTSVTPTPAPRTTTLPSTPTSSAQALAEDMLVALKAMEQDLLSLVQALNSTPPPTGTAIQLYDTIRNAPSFTIPEDEPVLQSIHLRYREQVTHIVQQGSDLYTHMSEIESGQATDTQLNPTHLSLAREAASAGTSTLQGLIRELEDYIASQP